MLLVCLFAPFLSFFVLFFFGRFLRRRQLLFINLVLMGFSFCIATGLWISANVIFGPIWLVVGPWINFDYVNISWCFLLDSLSVSMLFVVLLISFLVHIFSIDYMYNDPFFLKFMSYLSLFTFFMLLLITAGNFFQLFLGWEGVGLASYLLINFWFTRLQANKSAMKAVIVNRIGDFCLYFAILLLFYDFKTLDFNVIFPSLQVFSLNYVFVFGYQLCLLDVICLFLFLAAMGKSAQLGLHTWLPDAMEGPTPVSALIHAATMVTAGIFLLIRCSFLFEYSQSLLLFISCVGAITVIFSSTAGFFQFDLKKVIAYSTCSQLGYMVFACGNSEYVLSLYHLFNHAFFKALLFLGAGSIIHAMFDEQDIRRMGNLWRLLPVSYITFLIGSLSLMGLPFLTGFYSKDIIIEVTSSFYNVSGIFSFWLAIIAVSCTSYYSIRLFIFVFFNNSNMNVNVFLIKESTFFTLFVLILLSFLSIFIGFFLKDFFFGVSNDNWVYIYQSFNHLSFFEEEFLPLYIRLLPFIGTLIGIFFAYYVNKLGALMDFKYLNILRFLGGKWYFDIIFNQLLVLYILKCSYEITFKVVDRGLIEKTGSFGGFNFFKDNVNIFIKLQSGFIFNYIVVVFIGILLMCSFIFCICW